MRATDLQPMAIQEQSRGKIEETGSQWADNREIRIKQSEEKIIPVIDVKHIPITKMRRLGFGKKSPERRFKWQEDIRFGPDGEIYSTNWRDVLTEETEDNNRIISTPKYQKRKKGFQTYPYKFAPISTIPDISVIDAEKLTPKEREKIPDPEDLPKEGKVIQLVYSRVWGGLEDAIKQQAHILEHYDPFNEKSEPQKMHTIDLWIGQTADEFSESKGKPLTRKRLQELERDAASLLEITGLTNAQNETKQNIDKMLMNAAGVDSLGRINPTVSRIRLRSAMLSSRTRTVISSLTRQKFSANAEVLVAVRKATRRELEYARDDLREMGEITRRLEHDPSLVSEEERMQLSANAYEIAHTYLGSQIIAPYFLPSRMAINYLVGIKDEYKEDNRRILGDETADELYATPPAAGLLLSSKPEDQRNGGKQMRWAKAIIEDALDQNLLPSEEEKKASTSTSE